MKLTARDVMKLIEIIRSSSDCCSACTKIEILKQIEKRLELAKDNSKQSTRTSSKLDNSSVP
jgi:hypothetical protein